MQILIDFTQIPLNKVGVGVYGSNLIKWIHQLDKRHQYIILIQNDDNCFAEIKNPALTFKKVNNKIFRIFLFRLLLEQFYIPYLILRHRIKVVHSLHYSFPLINFQAKRVVTIHDLTFFIFPALHQYPKRYYFRFFTHLAAKCSDRIICVSKSTKADLLKYTKADEKKVDVVYLGIEKTIPEITAAQKKCVCLKYQISQTKKSILFVGTIEPRKNIATIIRTFIEFQKKSANYQLIIVGGKGWYYTDLFNIINDLGSSDVIFTGFIDEFEKQILLSFAHIFVYPSIYEGFGIPVLESLLFRIPTITSNVSSMPEVAGKAALLINPSSEEEMLVAFLKLASDQQLRDSLIASCFDQLKLFSWEKTARETINIYNSII